MMSVAVTVPSRVAPATAAPTAAAVAVVVTARPTVPTRRLVARRPVLVGAVLAHGGTRCLLQGVRG